MITWPRCSFIILMTFIITIITFVVNLYFIYSTLEEFYISPIKEDLTVKNFKPAKTMKNRYKLAHNDIIKRKKVKYFVAQKANQLVATLNASKKIRQSATNLLNVFKYVSNDHTKVLKKVINELTYTVNISVDPWTVAENWFDGNQVLPEKATFLGNILHSLWSAKIVSAGTTKKGSQLKLLLTLEGGQKALFKPQWYSRDEIIQGPVYAGHDRHNAEVAAFHLSLLLNIRRVPLTVGRKVNLKKEVMPVASSELLNTFYDKNNNTCFYGVCQYCTPKNSVCASKEIMEGALIMWLPSYVTFERRQNPWQRSYNSALVARWEVEENYCDSIKNNTKNKHISFLLDVIDSVVFDFLLDNGDRHHFEIPESLPSTSIFLFDNGKGFGNPNADHLDILAPLYQCCVIRKTTLERLKVFTGGSLSSSLEKTLKYSKIAPVLTKSHLKALDRRLLFIFATIDICIRENGIYAVLL